MATTKPQAERRNHATIINAKRANKNKNKETKTITTSTKENDTRNNCTLKNAGI